MSTPSPVAADAVAPATRGFTLLEVIVVLAAVGTLLVVLSQGLHTLLRTWSMQARSVATGEDVAAVDRALRTLISRADPGGVSGQPSGFVGTATTLSFTTTLPVMATQGVGALRTREATVTLLVDAAHRLQLRWLPQYGNWIAAPPPPASVELLDGVERMQIFYARPDGQWTAQWTALSLPRLVRIRLVFPAGLGLRWPDIVAAPMRDRRQS